MFYEEVASHRYLYIFIVISVAALTAFATSFTYTDPDTGSYFSVPDGWKQTELFTNPQSYTVKFCREEDSDTFILFGARDMYSEFLQSSDSATSNGESRAEWDIDNADISDYLKDFDIPTSVKYLGGIKYFKSTVSTYFSINKSNFNFSSVQTVFYTMKNGWQYMFSFNGTEESDYYADYEELIKSFKINNTSIFADDYKSSFKTEDETTSGLTNAQSSSDGKKISFDDFLIILIEIAIMALLPSFIAYRKKRSFWLFFFLSYICTPLVSFIIILFLRSREPQLKNCRINYDCAENQKIYYKNVPYDRNMWEKECKEKYSEISTFHLKRILKKLITRHFSNDTAKEVDIIKILSVANALHLRGELSDNRYKHFINSYGFRETSSFSSPDDNNDNKSLSSNDTRYSNINVDVEKIKKELSTSGIPENDYSVKDISGSLNCSCVETGKGGICERCNKEYNKLFSVSITKGNRTQSKKLCHVCATQTIKRIRQVQEDNSYITHDREIELVKLAYGKMNQKSVKELFYGDETEALKVLKPLRSVLFGKTKPTEDQYTESAFFYTQTWIRKHGGFEPQFSSTPYIKEAMKQRFSQFSADVVSKGVDVCLDYIYKHDPKLIKNGIKTTKEESFIVTGSSDYAASYSTGIKLFEQGNYSSAIKAFEKCIGIKQDDTSSRFEIAEAYINLGNLEKSKEVLLETVPYISYDVEKARLFRRLAFIEIENTNYVLATSLLVYSLMFEKNEKAINEIEYIISVTGEKFNYTKEQILEILSKNGMLFWQMNS